MGYELHITRADSWGDSSKTPISVEEWEDILRKDPELRLAGVNGPHFAVFADVADPYKSSWLNWSDGSIDSKYPTSRMVRKMISLAKQLGARVQGDEGEVYTLEEMNGIDEAFDKKLGYE
jgi:hypothetical protein